MTDKSSAWWHAGRHEDRKVRLHQRAKILQSLRNWFLDQDFIEIEPGALQASPGNETHLHAFETCFIDPALNERTYYLHTSPEFACKKLLAAGETKIFTFSKVYRNRELGPLHAPEFTMLEWYRANAAYEQVMADCLALIRRAANVADTEIFEWRDKACAPPSLEKTTTVADAFAARGFDLLATITADGPDDRALIAQAKRLDPTLKRFETWSALFSAILASLEPDLGNDALELLIDYPASESALAAPCPGNPGLAQRFEVYAAGIELANGFGELTDPGEQRARLEAQMEAREKIYGARYPIDEDFIAALETMPSAAGCALGFDRLVMLACGATSLDDVMWTPIPD